MSYFCYKRGRCRKERREGNLFIYLFIFSLYRLRQMITVDVLFLLFVCTVFIDGDILLLFLLWLLSLSFSFSWLLSFLVLLFRSYNCLYYSLFICICFSYRYFVVIIVVVISVFICLCFLYRYFVFIFVLCLFLSYLKP